MARELPVSRPAVSQHLRVLKNAGLVDERREGDPELLQRVEVRFTPERDGTRVDLEHRGCDRLEDEQSVDAYAAGWDVILAEYWRGLDS